ncbi:MAG: serine/threonine-protein kinase [Pirellulaceae bacterium]|nr:serine/threonine-protein kinase [Pirellulaceae bacterium]
MHSSERQLRSLLAEDTDAAIDPIIAEHVEHCAQCQSKLASLSGIGAWTNELVSHLRSLDQPERELRDQPPQTTVDLQIGESENAEIELDPISLDFLDPAAHPELLGRIGRFDVERVIGSGGMGVVFKAHDGELHRSVAVKVLAPHLAHSAAARKRFAREAQAAAAVIHPNVIPIHNVESNAKLPYLVMQYVAGESLQTRVDRLGPLPITDVLRIAQQTAAGLNAAHSQGLIHRDVKPANILLEESIDRVVLSDFGLARTVDDASLTRTGIVTGTPHYMSPEQASGEAIDCRSDQFSLGCVIYFMLTGRPPFRADSAMGVLNRICHHKHRPLQEVNASVPRELSRLVDRLLAKSAHARFASSQACEAELSRLLSAVQSGRLRLVETHPRIRLPLKIVSALALAASALVAPFAVQGYLGETVPEHKPAHEVAQPNTTPQIAVQSEADPAITLMESVSRHAADDPWRQSLHELSDSLQRYEQSNTSEIPWDWLQQQSLQSDQSLRSLDKRLSEIQEALERLPSVK